MPYADHLVCSSTCTPRRAADITNRFSWVPTNRELTMAVQFSSAFSLAHRPPHPVTAQRTYSTLYRGRTPHHSDTPARQAGTQTQLLVRLPDCGSPVRRRTQIATDRAARLWQPDRQFGAGCFNAHWRVGIASWRPHPPRLRQHRRRPNGRCRYRPRPPRRPHPCQLSNTCLP